MQCRASTSGLKLICCSSCLGFSEEKWTQKSFNYSRIAMSCDSTSSKVGSTQTNGKKGLWRSAQFRKTYAVPAYRLVWLEFNLQLWQYVSRCHEGPRSERGSPCGWIFRITPAVKASESKNVRLASLTGSKRQFFAQPSLAMFSNGIDHKSELTLQVSVTLIRVANRGLSGENQRSGATSRVSCFLLSLRHGRYWA